MTEIHNAEPGLKIISPDSWGDDLDLIKGNGSFQEIIGPRVGATARSMYHILLGPKSGTVPLSHPGEAVYFVLEGNITVHERSQGGQRDFDLDSGGMFHVRPGTVYDLTTVVGALILGGPSPADVPLTAAPESRTSAGEGISIHHRDRPGLMVPNISADARLVVWLGAGARTANMNYVVLEPGERNKEHVHRESEDTIHILEGHGTAENVSTGESFDFGPGDTVHINIGVWHAIAADRGERVVSVGGPCPADVDMLRAAGVDVDKILAGMSMP